MAGRASICHPYVLKRRIPALFIIFVRQPAGWLRVPYACKPRGGMPPHEGGKSMMPVCLAVKPVNLAAIRAFDAAVGGNRQKYARMAVPGFVRGAAAMQGQVGRGDDDGGLGLVGHDVSLLGGVRA